jgi:hypothetical protein
MRHLLKAIREDEITQDDLKRVYTWANLHPVAPNWDWYKDFGLFVLTGSDRVPLTYVHKGKRGGNPFYGMKLPNQNVTIPPVKKASQASPSVGYHVTPSYNLPRIMAEGLVPQIGDRSREIEEAEPGIYLFKSPQDVEDALANWLGEEFDGEEPIALLKVRIPADAVVVPTPAKYEFVISSVIPSENIQVVTEDTESPDQGFWSHLASELNSEDTTKTAAPKSVLQPGQKLTDLPAFKKWFQGSKVVDAQGNPLRVFRGDYRADRVSDTFKVNRSTSGRFYFTDDPEIASKYSEGKPDAQHSDENAMYETWFTFPDLKQPRERKAPNLKDAWWRLTPEQKARVREVCLTTTRTDQGEMTFDADSGITSAVSMDWTAKEHHGDWLAVLEEYWLSGGTLFGEEKEFIKILDHCGLSAIYDAPNDPRSVVTPVYLNIQNPLDTDRIPPDFVTRVHELAKKDRTKAQPYGYGAWDKSTITLAGWVNELDTDAKDNTSYAWTTIPEKVTKLLQSMGFDGIRDRGGKNGGTTHTVWIAFEPYQIKSAMGNKGTFDYMKDSIIASAAPVVAPLRQTAAIKGGTYYHGGPDIPGDVLRSGKAGAIFFTQSREYAILYMKGNPGVLYEIQLDFADRKVFDPENAGDIEQLREGFLALVNGEEYNDEESALNDYSYAIQHTLLDWAEGSQWFEPVEAAGFHGMRLRERPGMIGVNPDGSYSVSGDPIESVAMFDKEIKVERAVPQPYAETSLKQAAEAAPFERWFAGSKVVEDDGSPKIVYHGTYKKWDTAHTEEEDKAELDENFRASGVRIKDHQLAYDTASRTAGAVWFTDSEGTAEGFVSYNGDETDESGVMAAYLRILNPLDLRPEVVGIVQVKKVLGEVFGREEDFEAAGRVELDRMIAQAILSWDNSLLIQWAKGHGHDGLIYPDTDVRGRGTHTSYVTFRPNQIKSATDNTGAFDPENMSITAASAEELDWRPILTELMQVLKPGLPEPEIKFVKQKTNWLGTDYWAYRRSAEGVESADKNTVISIQKSVMGDEQTFRKVLAHELAHHEDNLVNNVAEFERLGFYTMKAMQRFTTDGGHGPKWQAIAARFNAKYGEGFVSRTSDQTYVVDSSVTKPFFVLMQRYVGGKIMWQYASRLSPKMRDLLVRRKREGDASEYPYRLFMTTEPLFLKAPTISPYGGYSIPRTDEQKAACEKLWAEGEDVLAQYAVAPAAKEAAATIPTDKLLAIAEEVRSRVLRNGNPAGNCQRVSSAIAQAINERFQLTGDQEARAYQGTFMGHPHTWVIVGDQWVDATNDQFDALRDEAVPAIQAGTQDETYRSLYASDSPAIINPKVIKLLTTQEPDTDGDHKVAARQRYADPPAPPDPQTETPAFKAWFSGSKVVDGGGRPLVVYHGAPDARFLKDVDTGVFKSPKERYLGKEDPGRAFFFAADHATAASYADDSRAFDYQAADPGVFAAYLCLHNPLVIDRHGERWKGTGDTITRAKADGHDGVIIRNTIDTYNVTGNRKTDVYAAFHPEQIKAAKGNRGDFNPGHKSVLAAIPSNLRTPVKPKSKEYDAVRRVYQYYVDHNIKTMPWARFQKEFQQVAAQYRDLFTELRHNRPAVTMDDLDAYLDEAVNTRPGYDVSYDRYHDKATSHRDVEQLVLQINQSASAANIIAEDSVLEQFVDMVRQASTQSGHPSGEKTVGWLRVDFIDADYILVDEVQSDLVNSVSQAKAMVEHRTFDEFMANIQSEKMKAAIEERGISREQFTRVRNNFIQSGFTAEKLDDIKKKLVGLFKDWAEYAISTVIEIARAHNIEHVCLHTAETVARRDDSVEADKVKIYYDQLARSFGFKQEEITDGDLKGKFWVRTAGVMQPEPVLS